MAARAKTKTTTEAAASLVAAKAAAAAGLDKKAEDVVVLDIRQLASYADYLVLMSAASDRQASAVADAADEALRLNGQRPIGVEGAQAGQWLLLDTGDIVVHVFQKDARDFYDLDSLWADAPRVALDAPKAS